MQDGHIAKRKHGFGTAPVYLTSITSILGAILFLRFGYATGMLGFWGALAIVLLGHLITIPTALAVSELATNTRVEGGGAYFIISRSFGLKIGSTIGIALFLAQAISIAFYTIAFAEAFEPLFDWVFDRYGFRLPRQTVSVPTLLIFSWVILKRGAGSGVVLLYLVSVPSIVPRGIERPGSRRSPLSPTPAVKPVKAGKQIAKRRKNSSRWKNPKFCTTE